MLYTKDDFVAYKYVNSINSSKYGSVFMANIHGQDFLIADSRADFRGEKKEFGNDRRIIAELTHHNACVLRDLFPFTAPAQILNHACSLGMGDRLGIATPAHIHVMQNYPQITPVFAQQSMRELNQTDRTYEDVLDSVTFSVFKCGFRRVFGADADHLKTKQEIEEALSIGYTMITLDLSDHIQQEYFNCSDETIHSKSLREPALTEMYLGKEFQITPSMVLHFSEVELKRIALIYEKALDFVSEVYSLYFQNGKYQADLEISIDETENPTTPLQHFFIANELTRRGVEFSSIAPRFCGEFQKGIDYLGDPLLLEADLQKHLDISRCFKYKISVHSGSDKFTVFPVIGKVTQGRFHLKTSGTSWLEAMRVIALKDPQLFRMIHKFALTVFDDVKNLYHVSTDLSRIPDIDSIKDRGIPDLFSLNDERQLIHITYGAILEKRDFQGRYVFKDHLFEVWNKHEHYYFKVLERHFKRHIDLLIGGAGKKGGMFFPPTST